MQRAYDRRLGHEVFAIRDGLNRPCMMHLFTTQVASWPRVPQRASNPKYRLLCGSKRGDYGLEPGGAGNWIDQGRRLIEWITGTHRSKRGHVLALRRADAIPE